MTKPSAIYRTGAGEIVRWTYDSATSPTDLMPLNAVGSWTCNGCGGNGRGTPAQAQRHAGQRHETNAGHPDRPRP